METPAQMCVRLVTALENLAAQEAACLQNRDYAAVVQIQERAAPLVEHLAAHGPEVADGKLRARIAALLQQRHENGVRLSAEIGRTRQQLQDLQATQRRAAQVAPVYGRSLNGG